MYPARDTLQHVIKACWKVAWKKAGKTLPVFFFREWTQQQKHEASSYKATILKVIREEKQQLLEEKDADNMRKVLYKSFIQWLWELNLCCYKYRVDCFGSLRLFFCCCWSESLDSLGNQSVLFSLESWCFPQFRRGKHKDSWENKTNCFPWDLTLSICCILIQTFDFSTILSWLPSMPSQPGLYSPQSSFSLTDLLHNTFNYKNFTKPICK